MSARAAIWEPACQTETRATKPGGQQWSQPTASCYPGQYLRQRHEKQSLVGGNRGTVVYLSMCWSTMCSTKVLMFSFLMNSISSNTPACRVTVILIITIAIIIIIMITIMMIVIMMMTIIKTLSSSW